MRFLHLDRILELEPGKHIRARKNVALDGEYLAEHFRRRPVVPGTIVLEALAQAAGWLNLVTHDDAIRMVVALVENVRFHAPVHVGDSLELAAQVLFLHPGGATMQGECRVDGLVVLTVERLVFANQSVDPAQLSEPEKAHARYVRRSTRNDRAAGS